MADRRWLTLPASNTVATGNIVIAPDAVSLSVSKSTLVGGGNITVKGNTRHNAAVDVYFKVSGEPLQLIDSVTADGNGDFSVPATVRQSGSFLAKTSTATSQSCRVKVVSTAKISARSLGKGWVRVTVTGRPVEVRHGRPLPASDRWQAPQARHRPHHLRWRELEDQVGQGHQDLPRDVHLVRCERLGGRVGERQGQVTQPQHQHHQH